MYWYRLPNFRKNFGDELGPFIVKELTGDEIRYIPIVNRWYKVLPLFFLGMLKKNFSIKIVKNVIYSIFVRETLISIGSIVSSFKRKNTLVWGAGLLRKDDPINPASFFAVRGIYTYNKIVELGYEKPKALGDPAMLMPLIIKSSSRKYKLGIIPHYIHYENVLKENTNSNVLVVNLLDEIEEVVKNISSCEFTVSSSLHGLIISHSYDIPSLWIEFEDEKLGGDNVKFKDYFSSVNIKDYSPYILKINDLNTIDFEQKVLESNKTLPLKPVITIQKELLKVFPYKIKKKYEVYL